MAAGNQEAIETFTSIAGVSTPVAIRRLEEHGGNLNEAINAHFSEGDTSIVQDARVTAAAPLNDSMDIDDSSQMESRGSPSSVTRGSHPFSLLDPTFRSLFDGRNLYDTNSEEMECAPFASQSGEVRDVPLGVIDGHDNSADHSSQGPRIEDVMETVHTEKPEICSTVILDNEDDDTTQRAQECNRSFEMNPRLSVTQFGDTPDFGNDIEEQMIQAAIDASKRDTEVQNKQDLHDIGSPEKSSHHNDADLVSMSLNTTGEGGSQWEECLKAGPSRSSADKFTEMEELGKTEESNLRQGVGDLTKPSSSQHEGAAGRLSIQDKTEELDEQPLVRHCSWRWSSGPKEVHVEVEEAGVSSGLSPSQPTVAGQTHGNAFPSDEWGGISSEEHDEAVMLEAAMFGGIPENRYHLPCAPHQLMRSGLETWRAPRPPSPGLLAQRAIREQQDDEYFASLQADREKELRAMEEEKVAREAALDEERRKEEESQRRFEEEQELERQLAAKEASIPQEPPLDDENTVTLLVKLPDGSRHGRRFLKSDKLQSLFDFIDVGRGVKPGTYRVVRSYPRRAFSDGESSLALHELGLTSKQEALFLELI